MKDLVPSPSDSQILQDISFNYRDSGSWKNKNHIDIVQQIILILVKVLVSTLYV